MEPTEKKPARKPGRRRLSPEGVELRIEYIRSLLRQSRPRGEIRQLFRETFKVISSTTFNMYFRLAGKRNLETLEKSENDLLAEAVAYWSRLIQEADEIIAQCRRDDEGYDQTPPDGEVVHLAGNTEMIRQAQELLVQAEATAEEKGDARRSLQLAQDRIDQNRKTVEAACKRSMDARRELDSILGMHSLTKKSSTAKRKGKKTVASLSDRELQDAMHRLGLEPLRFAAEERGE